MWWGAYRLELKHSFPLVDVLTYRSIEVRNFRIFLQLHVLRLCRFSKLTQLKKSYILAHTLTFLVPYVWKIGVLILILDSDDIKQGAVVGSIRQSISNPDFLQINFGCIYFFFLL